MPTPKLASSSLRLAPYLSCSVSPSTTRPPPSATNVTMAAISSAESTGEPPAVRSHLGADGCAMTSTSASSSTPPASEPPVCVATSKSRSARAAAAAYEAAAGCSGRRAAAVSGRIDHASPWDSSKTTRATLRWRNRVRINTLLSPATAKPPWPGRRTMCGVPVVPWPAPELNPGRCTNARRGVDAGGVSAAPSGVEHLGEDKYRTAAVRLAEVEVVDHGADDGDAHAAAAQRELGHGLALGTVDVVLVKAAALVADLDGHAVVMHGEVEMDLALVVIVGVPHGVGARLGERQFEVGDGVFGVAARAQQARKSKAAEHDVFGLGGDIELHVVVHGS